MIATATTEQPMIGHMSQPPAWTISSMKKTRLRFKVAANYNALKPDSP
jgi:hypothetical protein